MRDKDVRLLFTEVEVEVLKLRVSIPKPEDYRKVFLKLHNNMREDKDILEVNNFWCNNDIEMIVNLTAYINYVHKSKEEGIEHLKEWMVSGCDIDPNSVKVEIEKGKVYEPYEDQFEFFDEKDNFVGVYIRSKF